MKGRLFFCSKYNHGIGQFNSGVNISLLPNAPSSYQSFRELPRLLDLDLTEGDHDSPDAGEEATHSGGEGTREGPHPRTGREKGHTSLAQR